MGGPVPRIGAATAFLSAVLADGRDHARSTIMASAAAQGITQQVLWHAGRRLGVEVRPVGKYALWACRGPTA